MFLSLNVKAQTKFTVTVDSFFNFKFDKSLSASVALNSKKFIELDGHVGKTEITVNEEDLTIVIKFDTNSYTMKILGHPNGNKEAYIYEYKDQEKMIQCQMSFVDSDLGERFVLSEGPDPENPKYQIAWIARIKN